MVWHLVACAFKGLLVLEGFGALAVFACGLVTRFSVVITWLFCLCIDREFLQETGQRLEKHIVI